MARDITLAREDGFQDIQSNIDQINDPIRRLNIITY